MQTSDLSVSHPARPRAGSAAVARNRLSSVLTHDRAAATQRSNALLEQLLDELPAVPEPQLKRRLCVPRSAS